MAAAPSTEASQQMDINENEEQQIIEDLHPADVEAPASPERAASISNLKPPKSTIKTEQEAKIHIVDTIIYDILASDSTYHTPPSETIRKIYDSFSVILAKGIDLASAVGDYTLITLIEYMKQTSVDKSTSPWDLSHQHDPISMFTVLDNIHYEKFIRTGSIILEGIDQSMPYVHHHPHLFQSPLAAINFCIVDHALHRISEGKGPRVIGPPPSEVGACQPHLSQHTHGIFEAISSRPGVGASHEPHAQHQQVCQDILLSSGSSIIIHQ